MPKGNCKVENCEKPAAGKGYCARHYRKWRRGEMPKARYKICSEEGCRKPRSVRAKCAEHAKKPGAQATGAAGTGN